MRKTPPRSTDFGPTVLSLSVPASAPARRRVLGWVAAFAVVSGVLVATALWLLHREAVRWGEQLTSALARIITEQTTRSIQTVDQRLQFAEQRLREAAAEGVLEPAFG